MRHGLVIALVFATGAWVQTQTPATLPELRALDQRVTDLSRSGDLRRVAALPDQTAAGGIDERFEQRHLGVRVFGAGVTRHVNRFGQAESVFDNSYANVNVDSTPSMSLDAATPRLAEAGGGTIVRTSEPELTILPREAGTYRLTYSARVMSATDGWIRRVFIDADSGATVDSYIDTWTQTPAIGTGAGVVGDTKKIMTGLQSGGTYIAADMLRPPDQNVYGTFPKTGILTFDLKGNILRTLAVLNTVTPTFTDIATDADNTWTDPGLVDAHTYAGYTYDFYYKRFGRQGLDNRNIQMWVFTNPVKASDYTTLFNQYGGTFFLNAFYMGNGNIVFGVGLPPNVFFNGQQFYPFSGALDVVAHELTHGVTEYTSNLTYRNESGALNESFSDMMGAAVEFTFQPLGSAPGQADWLLGEDIQRPRGTRSFIAPFTYGHPDHYSIRYTGLDDGGGVHTNSSIVNHMFYLAIMGGTNRVSQQTVTGVGFENRAVIENSIYRAFTTLLPASATFSMARAATIQAARDLYGSNSAAERALIAAWSAVGVS